MPMLTGGEDLVAAEVEGDAITPSDALGDSHDVLVSVFRGLRGGS
jgi:predicted RNA-binding protein